MPRCVFIHVDHPWLSGMRGDKGFEKEVLSSFTIVFGTEIRAHPHSK